MRDTIQQICEELMSPVLPLFRPTANNQSNMEPETDCYQLNERCVEPHNLLKLSFCGYMMGWSLISVGSLNLDLPSAFWNRLCGGLDYLYTLKDLTCLDKLLADRLEKVLSDSKSLSADEFNVLYADYFFVFEELSADGSAPPLCEGGEQKSLTQENASEYVELHLQKYTKRDQL